MRLDSHFVEILVLDFGSQYTQLIARRLREYGVYTEIVPYFEKLDSIKSKNPKGIILSGGPASVYEEGAYKPDSRVFRAWNPRAWNLLWYAVYRAFFWRKCGKGGSTGVWQGSARN